MVLEKCGTADRSPAAVTVEERIGWIPLWEMALDCGERCACEKDPVASKLKGATPRTKQSTYPHHRNRGSTELHGHKFAVFFFRILSCFV